MASKIRNIIIFIIIAAVFVLIYIFFIKPSSPQAGLISSPASTALPSANNSGINANITNGSPLAPQDFLALLLNVQTIKLDVSIFSNPAFNSLHDSSIILTPDGTQGRPDPFAQFGAESTPASPVSTHTISGTGAGSAPSKP
jgi:hypothetical protein